jgi:hypothetical protein
MSTLRTDAITTVAGKPILNSTGGILQVVHTTLTTSFAGTSVQTGSGLYVNVPGLSATITPTSTTSKILILTHMYVGASGGGSPGYQQHFRIKRNGTPILVGAGEGGRVASTGMINMYNTDGQGNQYNVFVLSGTHYDSPTSISSLTYQIEMGGWTNSPDVFVNRSRVFQNAPPSHDSTPVSTLTLMEVSG